MKPTRPLPDGSPRRAASGGDTPPPPGIQRGSEHPGGSRIRAAEELLRAGGVPARVRAVGWNGEIAAVEADPLLLPRLAELALAVRKLGFRHLALDLRADGVARTTEGSDTER